MRPERAATSSFPSAMTIFAPRPRSSSSSQTPSFATAPSYVATAFSTTSSRGRSVLVLIFWTKSCSAALWTATPLWRATAGGMISFSR